MDTGTLNVSRAAGSAKDAGVKCTYREGLESLKVAQAAAQSASEDGTPVSVASL